MDESSFDSIMDQAAESLGRPGPIPQTELRIVEVAVEVVPHADHASLSLLEKAIGQLSTVASTDDVVRQLDEWQYALKEGPCYVAATQQLPCSSDDVGADPRWPQFGPKAPAPRIRSQMALPLRDDGGSSIGLSVYSRGPRPSVSPRPRKPVSSRVMRASPWATASSSTPWRTH